MTFQAELKDTYWGADGVFWAFNRAREKLLQTAGREDERTAMVPLGNAGMSQPISHLTPTFNDFNQTETSPSVDDILNFDFAFAEQPDFSVFATECL